MFWRLTVVKRKKRKRYDDDDNNHHIDPINFIIFFAFLYERIEEKKKIILNYRSVDIWKKKF
jgi:hypothetical protein